MPTFTAQSLQGENELIDTGGLSKDALTQRTNIIVDFVGYIKKFHQLVSSQDYLSSQHLNIGTLKVTRVGIQDYNIQTDKETKAALLYENIGESVDFGSALAKANEVAPTLIKAKCASQIAEELAFEVADCGTEISYSDGSAIVYYNIRYRPFSNHFLH